MRVTINFGDSPAYMVNLNGVVSIKHETDFVLSIIKVFFHGWLWEIQMKFYMLMKKEAK
jgi:hypothetical protein